ncbi:MAG TPA: AbrB/MazE/SpoVT family DNA-binding domain-containing protein [Caulobacteraceae bacterium]|nr:AbrB/MazE/SpoVT family DNA-binding domain-containing protein [Caulobacteraceae bacterium]
MAGVREAAGSFEPEVRAKLFKHGGSQAVRLPKAFRFEGTEVSVRRDGDAVILEPVKPAFRRPRTDAEIAAFWAEVDRHGNADFPDRVQDMIDWRDYDW